MAKYKYRITGEKACKGDKQKYPLTHAIHLCGKLIPKVITASNKTEALKKAKAYYNKKVKAECRKRGLIIAYVDIQVKRVQKKK